MSNYLADKIKGTLRVWMNDAWDVPAGENVDIQNSAVSHGEFKLEVDGIVFGAGVALGKQGLTDGVIAFSDGSRDLIYRGFICDIDDTPVGGVENVSPILEVEAITESGALRIAWDMPGTVRTERGAQSYRWLVARNF